MGNGASPMYVGVSGAPANGFYRNLRTFNTPIAAAQLQAMVA